MSLQPLCRERLLNFFQAKTWTPRQASIQMAVCHLHGAPSTSLIPPQYSLQRRQCRKKKNDCFPSSTLNKLLSHPFCNHIQLLLTCTWGTINGKTPEMWGQRSDMSKVVREQMGGRKRLQLRATGGKSRLAQAAYMRQNFPALQLHHTLRIGEAPQSITILKPKTLIKLFHCNSIGSKITPDLN